MFITWNKNLPIVFSAIHHTAVSLKYNLYINCLPHKSNSWWMLIKDLYQHHFLYTPIILQLIRTLVDTSPCCCCSVGFVNSEYFLLFNMFTPQQK